MEAKIRQNNTFNEIYLLRMQGWPFYSFLDLWILPKLVLVWKVWPRNKLNPSTLSNHLAQRVFNDVKAFNESVW